MPPRSYRRQTDAVDLSHGGTCGLRTAPQSRQSRSGVGRLATVIANEYHNRRKVQLAAYGVASAVSLARFTSGKHYLSDVLIGSLPGYGIGQYVYRTHHQKEKDSADTEEELQPRCGLS